MLCFILFIHHLIVSFSISIFQLFCFVIAAVVVSVLSAPAPDPVADPIAEPFTAANTVADPVAKAVSKHHGTAITDTDGIADGATTNTGKSHRRPHH